MEASEEILVNSLSNSGVPFPAGFSSIRDLTPPSLFSLCSYALRLIDGHHYASSFPTSLPDDSMTDRVKICTELSHAFNKLGYNPELSFHKFLYPSEEDLYNLVRFLVGKLSESSGGRTAALGEGDSGRSGAKEKLRLGGDGGTVQNEKQGDLAERAAEPNLILHDVQTRVEDYVAKELDLGTRKNAFGDQVSSQKHGEVLNKPMMGKCSNLQHPAEELRLLKAAAEMVFDGHNPVEFHIEQLNDQVEAKRHKLKELQLKWDAVEKPLQEKKRNLEQSVLSLHRGASEKLTRMKEIELETESVLAEIERREEELSKLSSDLEKQPKLAPRRSYIERVNEITKNRRKQDNDIERILKDTRELQLESNTIQDRLNRTYAIVNETIFREAKKDLVVRQAYRLLTNIHESFEQIAEKILATDRTRREAADYEAKLAIISARSLNVSKLQADIDAIRKENELLDQRLH